MATEKLPQHETIDFVTEDTLLRHGIDPTIWGTEGYKTLNHLNAELAAGEATLISENGQLIRFTRVLGLDVCCDTPDGLKILQEARQEFGDGRTRMRSLPTSLGEKMTPDEDVLTGVERALLEEMGIQKVITIGRVSDETRERQSPSYPGILTRSLIHTYVALIDPSEYNPAGYAEHQSDKSTYFEWQ